MLATTDSEQQEIERSEIDLPTSNGFEALVDNAEETEAPVPKQPLCYVKLNPASHDSETGKKIASIFNFDYQTENSHCPRLIKFPSLAAYTSHLPSARMLEREYKDRLCNIESITDILEYTELVEITFDLRNS